MEEIAIKYIKCVSCGAVRESTKWINNACPECKGVEKNDLIEIVAPFTKSELDELDDIKKQKAELDKRDKKLAPKIKNFLVENQITDFEFMGHRMQISVQDRSTMDEDKVVNLIQKVMSEEEIEATGALKYVSNPDVVTQLISDGRITVAQLSECKIPNIIPVFNLNKNQKKKKIEASPFGGML